VHHDIAQVLSNAGAIVRQAESQRQAVAYFGRRRTMRRFYVRLVKLRDRPVIQHT
jgi:hypothetical protein